jgi:hypothetical protein
VRRLPASEEEEEDEANGTSGRTDVLKKGNDHDYMFNMA